MPIIGPNTPGTIVLLAATIILGLVSLSPPFDSRINFLEENVDASISSLNRTGTIRMGVFGYCILESSGVEVCSDPAIGYSLDPITLLGLKDLKFMRLNDFIKLNDSTVLTITRALVLHPIAAGLAGLSFIAGIISHSQDLSRTCWIQFLTSIASTVTFLALIFDVIFFSVIKSRLNSGAADKVPRNDENLSFIEKAKLRIGIGVWLTLIAWLLLSFSGCVFCLGRCLFCCSNGRRKARGYKEAENDRFQIVGEKYDAKQ
ncbi:actin cortical patch SUR7/pH-response regulator pali [Phakopsora pachyrhizi]|uniref:Actin cortical patch SUR7/pH-response regulator pali n=1 Tax=Phakopsora pachyrhizi TaxID=170000 RepID=A0AAV0B2X2_PHAPC|nr:actin cortical patch SUR7/pH-response regulator pali [Phakopsora pachyrhizi]CAH7676260.1 actin cortical patch SUR7/pH-response regulator pali [Phakopsora pachyrhizi]